MRTTNSLLKEKVFTQVLPGAETMTAHGTVNKTSTLLALLVIGAGWTWNFFYNQSSQAVMPWMMTGLILTLVWFYLELLGCSRNCVTVNSSPQ